ncbi:MAG TPA: DUF167 domain-containing protein [Acidimicrobiales bacterium]|jgi:uncharacterized protein (TIGR00251 family)|nr:DUF167 domain-containing protein [Acidimicrobiales bacterium]
MSDHPELNATDGGVVLAVHVQPGAGRTEVVGRHGDALKLRVAAPPTDNRANDAVLELVAKEFNLKRADVAVTSGATSRAKKLRLSGLSVDAAARVVDRLLDSSRPRSPRR